MCYSGKCQWENHMGDCQKYYPSSKLPCPTDFEAEFLENKKVAITEYEICGGPLETITFNTVQEANDYISAQQFAYKLLVKCVTDN